MNFSVCYSFAEREKQLLIKGDEPTVLNQQSRRSLNSTADATTFSLTLNNTKTAINPLTIDSNHENEKSEPIFGHWGQEWPS